MRSEDYDMYIDFNKRPIVIPKDVRIGMEQTIKEHEMTNPLITILIRTMPSRIAQYGECLNSIKAQTYQNVDVKVYRDNPAMRTRFECDYNLFCNELKSQVNDGWFFFLDDDDFLNAPDSLEQIAKELTNHDVAVLCQFLRGGIKPKPSGGDIRNKFIRSGHVGLPCLILHHSQKQIADVQACDNGDFLYIEAVSKKIPIKFVEKILVNSPKRNYGL